MNAPTLAVRPRDGRAPLVVGIGEMRCSSSPDDVLVTHALGSCLAVAVHDAVAGVGGLIHVLLPDSTSSPERAAARPCLFVDTGVPALFRACYALGATKERMIVAVVGGAAMRSLGWDEGSDVFQVGRRNVLALRKLFWRNGVLVARSLVGGAVPRNVALALRDGSVRVTSNGVEVPLEGGEGWR